MLPIGAVARYIDAVSARVRQAQSERPWGCYPFITVSRQAGISGHALAEHVRAEMAQRRVGRPDLFCDWQVFDEELLRLLTEHPGFKATLEDLAIDEYRTRWQDLMHQILTGSPPQDIVLARVFHSLRAVAGLGKAVIIGRSGACLTRDLPKGVHVRLVASPESRLRQLSQETSLNRRQALHRLRRLDAGRAALVRDHFGRDIQDPLLYDAVWNVDAVPLPDIARWLCDAVERKRSVVAPSESLSARLH